MASNTVQGAGEIPVDAIVPAAGRSRRMGRPKQLLEVGGRAMLEAAVEPLAAPATIERIVVVTHSEIARRIDLSAAPNVTIAINDDETSEMIDSVRMGLEVLGFAAGSVNGRAAESPDNPRPAAAGPQTMRGILVVPGDQPGLAVGDIRACVDAFRRAPDRVVIGAWQGRRGHPIIFPATLVPFVMSNACNEGLRALPRRHASLVRTVECGSPAAIRNINTPGDFENFQTP